MNTLKFKTYAGDSFQEVTGKCKFIAGIEKLIVEFDFNGIVCLVDKDTNTDWLWRDYLNAHLMDWETIGPNCASEYDAETQTELSARRTEREKKQKKAQDEYEQKCAAEKETVDALTKDVVLLIHSDKRDEYDAYVTKNSQDGYSRAVIDYAEQWAKLMQIEIAKGRTAITDIANECQQSLGYLGITGFQYGCVVGALSHFWVFGEELRRWHNNEYGVSEDKKGVVNPAVLTIG